MSKEFITETGSVVNLFLVYQFLKRLTTPFIETDAFKLGIIDERGKRTSKKMKTKEERESWRMFDRLVFRLKMLIEKLPLGRSRLASYAAALLLIKEDKEWTLGNAGVDTKKVEKLFLENMDYLNKNGSKNFRMLREEIVNTVGSGNIAGAAPGEDPPIFGRQRGKKPTANTVGRKTFTQFTGKKSSVNELTFIKPKAKDTLGVLRVKMPQVASKHFPELLQWLERRGVKISNEMVKASSIKAIQKEFSDQGIAKSILKTAEGAKAKPLILSKDNFIIDGHHRWLATVNTFPNKKLPVVRVNVSGKELLKMVSQFPKTTFKDIFDSIAEEKLRAIDSKIINFNDHPNCGTKDCCRKC